MKPEHILGDLVLYRYPLNIIEAKVQEAKRLGINPIKPWIMRCSAHLWERWVTAVTPFCQSSFIKLCAICKILEPEKSSRGVEACPNHSWIICPEKDCYAAYSDAARKWRRVS